MGLICLSYSHKHTPIAFRERIHFDENAVANACARFRCGDDGDDDLQELTILSTCNRTEIFAYAARRLDRVEDKAGNGETVIRTGFENADFLASDSVEDHDFREQVKHKLLNFVAEARGISFEDLQTSARWFHGAAVVDHLARVASGLESMVLGESQILGQVGDAMRMGLIMNSTGPVLTKLFQATVTCGRRARKETEIGLHSANIATLAVNSAQRQLGSVDGKSILLLGAGNMAELALAQLRRKRVGPIMVVNRTISKARELADKVDGSAHVYEQIMELLPSADILLCSTGAPHTLITPEMIAPIMRRRSNRLLTILDIAVPRDVDTSVDEIDNVWRCDIDDLQIAAGQSVEARESAIPDVEQIVETEVQRYLTWLHGVGVEQTVTSLRRMTEEIRDSEFRRMLGLLPDLPEEASRIIEQFSHSLTNKLLHNPTTRLRELNGTRSAVNHGEAIRELFDLEQPEQSPIKVDSNSK